MKKRLFLIMVLMVSFSAANTFAATTKVLINVVQEQGDASSAALIKETEMMMAKGLLSKKFDIMTSDDFSARKGFTREDVDIARSGSIPELRRVAGFNDAAYIFSAKTVTTVSQEEVLNMKMNKATTSVAWRIVRTSDGGTIDMGSASFPSSARSPGEATASTFRRMSDEMTRIVSKKLPTKLPAKRAEELSVYRTSLVFKPEPAATSPSMVVAQASGQTSGQTPSKSSSLPSEGPEIVILNPPATRGFIPVAREKELDIEGMAVDPLGISEVRINGERVAFDQEGKFTHRLNLKSNQDHVLIMAVNTVGKMASKNLPLDRQEDKQAPELVVLRPEVSRGFQIALAPEEKQTIVEGIVKDSSDILFVRVNDQKVAISETGHFLQKLKVDDSVGKISIQAADVHGNITRKAFEIARGDGAWTRSSSAAAGLPSGSTGKPVLWGLAIGVSKYNSSSINLKYAHQDALHLEKFFKAQEGESFSEVHFKTLVNEEVTRNTIIEAITRHLGQAAPNDVIFIFVAGHGTQHRQSGSYYFMPSNSDFDNLLATGLRMSDFEESVKILSNNVNKIIVAMDTCHSGAMKVGMRSVGGGEDLAGAINAASGLYILSASKAGEASLESEEFTLDPDFTGHGAFTYALVKAMRGQADYDKDEYVSVNEMFQFVARQVPRLTNGKQHPYFRMQGTDLPLVKVN